MPEVWLQTDPRHSFNKRANIVIVRPSANGRKAGTGHVDTKEVWGIWTDFEDHKYISADDKWDMDWYWTWAPKL